MVKSRVCLVIFLEPLHICFANLVLLQWLDFITTSVSHSNVVQLLTNWSKLSKTKKHFSFQNHHTNTFSSIFFFQELGLSPSVPVHVVLQDWIRHSDGKLSFLGFVRLLHGVSSRAFQRAWNWTVLHVIFPILTFLDLKCLKVTNCKLEFWELP